MAHVRVRLQSSGLSGLRPQHAKSLHVPPTLALISNGGVEPDVSHRSRPEYVVSMDGIGQTTGQSDGENLLSASVISNTPSTYVESSVLHPPIESAARSGP